MLAAEKSGAGMMKRCPRVWQTEVQVDVDGQWYPVRGSVCAAPEACVRMVERMGYTRFPHRARNVRTGLIVQYPPRSGADR